MFSYGKCNLNMNLPAVPSFRIDYFCLNKDSAISLDVFLQLAIKLVTDCKSQLCRRKIKKYLKPILRTFLMCTFSNMHI